VRAAGIILYLWGKLLKVVSGETKEPMEAGLGKPKIQTHSIGSDKLHGKGSEEGWQANYHHQVIRRKPTNCLVSLLFAVGGEPVF